VAVRRKFLPGLRCSFRRFTLLKDIPDEIAEQGELSYRPAHCFVCAACFPDLRFVTQVISTEMDADTTIPIIFCLRLEKKRLATHGGD
jgi:hypothetical protein